MHKLIVVKDIQYFDSYLIVCFSQEMREKHE